MKKHLIAIIFSLCSSPAFCQLIDVGFAPIIAGFMYSAEKQQKAQLGIMGLQTTGHVWLKEEVDGVVNLHKEFNEYLDSFNEVLTFLAQCYGVYYEIDKLTSNFTDLTSVIAKSPSNLVAVALHSNRSKINRDLVMISVDIVDEIRKVCLSKSKLTEKERLELIFAIRPKLKKFNKQLRLLIKAVKYTSLADVWAEITLSARPPANKKEIAKQCYERWQRNARGNYK